MNIRVTNLIENAAAMARMATDTLPGLKRIDAALELFRVGLISEGECIAKLRG